VKRNIYSQHQYTRNESVMGIQVQWDEFEPDTILINLESDWAWDEYHAAARHSFELAHRVTHPVYVIVLAYRRFPGSPGDVLMHLLRVSKSIPQNMALIILVTNDFFIESVNQVLFRISPTGRQVGRLAKTSDEARRMIVEHRAKHKPVS
jgi:hypothetical protein